MSDHDESLLASIRRHLSGGKARPHIIEALLLAGWQRDSIERGINHLVSVEAAVSRVSHSGGRHQKLTTLVAVFLGVHLFFLTVGFSFAEHFASHSRDEYIAFFGIIILLGILLRGVYRRHKLSLVAVLVYASVIFVDIMRTFIAMIAEQSGVMKYLNSAEGLISLALFITAVVLFEVSYGALELKD